MGEESNNVKEEGNCSDGSWLGCLLQCIEVTRKPPPPPSLPGLQHGLHTLIDACLVPPTFILSLMQSGLLPWLSSSMVLVFFIFTHL